MKISTALLIILLSLNLAACVGGGDDNADTSGTDNSDNSNTGDSNTGDSNNGDSNTGDSNTGDSNTDDSNTASCSNGLPDTSNQSNYQIVYDDCIVWDGDIGTVIVKYNSDASELTGLGLRIHYDSSSMTYISASDVLAKDLIGSPETSSNDNQDFDQNSSTNKYIIAAWASIEGDWPGQTDQNIATLQFQKIDGGSTYYNLGYSANSVPPGITFNP